jgi:hypothetical protein
MFDDKMDQPHDRDEDASYAEFRIEFHVTETGDDEYEGQVAAVHSHIHHVPGLAAVDALLLVAKGLLVQQMEQGMHMPEGAPDSIREQMLDMMATVFLKQRMDSDTLKAQAIAATSIPDDISELFG